MDQEVLPPDYGTNIGTDVLGIPGTNGDGGTDGDIRASGAPGFYMQGYTPLGGAQSWTPIFRNDRSYNLSANATYVKGGHELRFGADVVRMELNHWQPEEGYGPAGGFGFNGGATALAPRGSPNPFNAYAQFLLGLTTAASKSLQYERATGREWQLGLYVRDRWQVTSALTLNLGLRFEHYPLMTRADRGIEYYDDTTNQVLLGGKGGNPEDLGIEVQYPRFLPRVGFAWRLGENNVVRGGYGMTVSPMPFSRPLRGVYPATISQFYTPPSPFMPFGTLEGGIPALLRTRSEHRLGRPADDGRDPVALPGSHLPRLHPVLEPDLRAPAALGHVAVCRLRGHGRLTRWAIGTSTPRGRAKDGPERPSSSGSGARRTPPGSTGG